MHYVYEVRGGTCIIVKGAGKGEIGTWAGVITEGGEGGLYRSAYRTAGHRFALMRMGPCWPGLRLVLGHEGFPDPTLTGYGSLDPPPGHHASSHPPTPRTHPLPPPNPPARGYNPHPTNKPLRPLGLCLAHTGRWEEAEEVLAELLREPVDSFGDLYSAVGGALAGLGQHEK